MSAREGAARAPGRLEVICGPMFSGKTEELIRRLKREVIARRKVQCFKPAVDARYDAEAVVSHSAQRVRSTQVGSAREIFDRLLPGTEVVGIDEVQFLGTEALAVCEELCERGLRVIVAGLDLDYRGRPFEPVPQLLALADEVSKEHAVCVVCGGAGTRSQRTTAQSERVVVGAADAYEPRCRSCFSPEPRARTPDWDQPLLPLFGQDS